MAQIRSHLIFITLILLFLASLGVAFLLFAFPKQEQRRPPDPQAALDYYLGLQQGDYSTYTDPTYGFTFTYPRDFRVSGFRRRDRDTVVAENPSVGMGFRITVINY